MRNRILVADDERSVHNLLRRVLPPETYAVSSANDGQEALSRAREERPDLMVLDIHMPGKNGLDALAELRQDPRTRTMPVILLTGDGAPEQCVRGLDKGADDFMTKPFRVAELAARIASVLRRSRRDIGANPLTRLPGSPTIEEEIQRRIEGAQPFACMYVDIDRFKAYNDAYGYAQGDRIILRTANLLTDALRVEDPQGGLVGHIGGDDFVVVCSPEAAWQAAPRAARAFDAGVPEFYREADRRRGFVETRDRLGSWRRFGLVTLSIGAVTTATRRLDSYAKVAELASEMKAYAKSRQDKEVSAFAFDRRRDW